MATLRRLRACFRGVGPAGPTPVGQATVVQEAAERGRAELEGQGFTIQDGAVDHDVLLRLRTAARTMVAAAARRDERGFAMRGGEGAGAWGLRGIYDPAWGEISQVFRDYMSSEAVQNHAREFLGCGRNDLLLPDTDFLIFCDPPEGYSQRWHRDIRWYGAGGDFSEAGQRARWEEIQAGPGGAWARGAPHVSGHNDYMVENGGAQLRWQLALVDMPDCGVDYVPGSHRRFRTSTEEAALLRGEQISKPALTDTVAATPQAAAAAAAGVAHDGFSPIPAHAGSPGSSIIGLKAGQAVFWNGDGIHRGFTRPGVERLTLSCALVRWNGVQARGQDPGRIEMNGRPLAPDVRCSSRTTAD